jgi:hypothetical protein
VRQLTATDAGRDWTTNVVYHIAATASAATHGDAIKALFTAAGKPYNLSQLVTVKVYDHSLPLHSPPVYTTTYPGSGVTGLGPRQVALCLSYYSGLNVKGQRGRIYIGPWQNSDLTEYPATSLLNSLLSIGTGLLHVGAADTQHVIWHPKLATFSNVSNYFVNNRWDTMRSRLPKETNRVHSP